MMEEDIIPPTTKEKMARGLVKWQQRKTEDLRIERDDSRGLCVVATRDYQKWDFVCEYEAEFITHKERVRREKGYAADDPGSFVVDAWWDGKEVALDATRTLGTFGRLVNHARDGNLKPYPQLLQVSPDEPPRMVLYCHTAIKSGEEVFWNYGLGDDEAPWASFKRSTMTNKR